MRRVIAAVCTLAVALLPACGKEPNSLFDAAGYHVRGDTVFYLRAFPGDAFEIAGADAATFELLDRPNFAKDARHVFRHDDVASDDPAHFELLEAELSKDSQYVYWSDGSVLSDDPQHFEIVSTVDYYPFTKDRSAVHVNGTEIAGADPATFRVLRGAYARDDAGAFYFTDAMPLADADALEVLEGSYARDTAHAYWMGKVIDGADPMSFVVLNGNFECTADATRAYYRDVVIAGAVPSEFPPGKAVTNCSETSISFAP